MNKNLITLSVTILILMLAISVSATELTSLRSSTANPVEWGTFAPANGGQVLTNGELDEEFSDSLVYHDFTNAFYYYSEAEDFLAGYRFTTPAPFTIQGLRFFVSQSATVEEVTVGFYTTTTAEHDSLMMPDELLYEWDAEPTSVSEETNFNAPYPGWVELVFDEADYIALDEAEDVWVVIGPCPGEGNDAWGVGLDQDGAEAGFRCRTAFSPDDPLDYQTPFDFIINLLGEFAEDFYDVRGYALYNDIERFHLASETDVTLSAKFTNGGTVDSPAGDVTFTVMQYGEEDPVEVFSNTVAIDPIASFSMDTVSVTATEAWTPDEEGHYIAEAYIYCDEDESVLENNTYLLLQDVVNEYSWIAYDDGISETTVSQQEGSGWCVPFYPLEYPASIDSIMIWFPAAHETTDIRVATLDNQTLTEVWTYTGATDSGWTYIGVESEEFPEGININGGSFLVAYMYVNDVSFHSDADPPTSASNPEMPEASWTYREDGLFYDQTGNWMIRARMGTGVAPEISFPETELEFPETMVGTSSEIEIYVDNLGTGIGHINEVIIAQSVMDVLAIDEAFPIEIAPGTRDSLTAVWAPDEEEPEDLDNAIVRVLTDDINEPPNGFMIRLSGLYKLSVREMVDAVPNEYFLGQNYPNPFNPTTEIRFGVREAGHVSMAIYNLMGQEVGRLVDQQMQAGTHMVSFDASNLASGVYYYSIEVNGFRTMKKMALIR